MIYCPIYRVIETRKQSAFSICYAWTKSTLRIIGSLALLAPLARAAPLPPTRLSAAVVPLCHTALSLRYAREDAPLLPRGATPPHTPNGGGGAPLPHFLSSKCPIRGIAAPALAALFEAPARFRRRPRSQCGFSFVFDPPHPRSRGGAGTRYHGCGRVRT